MSLSHDRFTFFETASRTESFIERTIDHDLGTGRSRAIFLTFSRTEEHRGHALHEVRRNIAEPIGFVIIRYSK